MIGPWVAALALSGPALPGSKIEPFEARSPEGHVVTWSPGRPTVVTFFALWCDTWKTQLPRAQKAKSALETFPIDFWAISLDGRWSELMPSYPGLRMALDPRGGLRQTLGIDRIPATLAIDSQGVVRWASYGTVRSEDIVRAAKSLLQPAPTRTLALTFDDFPSADAELLLDELRRLDVKASLFVVCDRAQSRAKVLCRAVQEGHSLQIHGWHHTPGKVDIQACQNALMSAAGVQAGWLRAPGSEKLVPLGGQADVPPVNPYDYLGIPQPELIRRTLLKAKAGAAVQLHDGVANTRRDLGALVSALKQAGYRLEPLP